MGRYIAPALAITWLATAVPAQEAPTIRVQTVGGRTYFQVRLNAPVDLRVPRPQRDPLAQPLMETPLSGLIAL